MGLTRETQKGVLCGTGGKEYEERNRKDVDHLALTPTNLVAKIDKPWVVVNRD